MSEDTLIQRTKDHLGDLQAVMDDLRTEVARLTAERDEARAALHTTHGVAQAMAFEDSWIAVRCGMVDDGEGDYYVPAAREVLAAAVESEPER